MLAKHPLSIFTNLLGLCKLYLVKKYSIFLKFLAFVVIQLWVYAQNAYRINRQIAPELF